MVIRLVLGPPIGGALYSRFGFRGPFIFGIIFAFVDLLGRLVIIERKDALKWGHDPHNPSGLPAEVREAATSPPSGQEKSDGRADSSPTNGETNVNVEDGQPAPKKSLSQIAVLIKLAKSPRALAAALVSLIYG
jgi:MFS family permease